jgi:hypothetical protein
MQSPETGLDESTKKRLDRLAIRLARIAGLSTGAAFIVLGVWGCVLFHSVRYLMFSLLLIVTGIGILRSTLKKSRP